MATNGSFLGGEYVPPATEMPYGGFARDGYRKDLSMYGFEDYTRIKHVMANIDS